MRVPYRKFIGNSNFRARHINHSSNNSCFLILLYLLLLFLLLLLILLLLLLLLLCCFMPFAHAVLNAEVFLLGEVQLIAKRKKDAFILPV